MSTPFRTAYHYALYAVKVMSVHAHNNGLAPDRQAGVTRPAFPSTEKNDKKTTQDLCGAQIPLH